MGTLRWLLHLAWSVLSYPNEEADGGDLKGLKVEDSNGGLSADDSRNNTDMYPSGFQMPLHYPRYTKEDYLKMEEWKVDLLLKQYGLPSFKGTLEAKRAYTMGTFLWPDQY